MKKFIIAFVVLSVVAVGAIAQTPVKGNVLFGGMKYSNDASGGKSIVATGGYGYKLLGNLWQFNTVEVAAQQYGAVTPEIGYFAPIHTFKTGVKMYGAILAGPSADWIKAGQEGDYLAYLTGAAGGLGYVEFPQGIGLWVAAKQKFAFKEGTLFRDGLMFGVGLAKKF